MNRRCFPTVGPGAVVQNSVMEKQPKMIMINCAKQGHYSNCSMLVAGLMLLLLFLPASDAKADSFRCGLKVVRSGDAQSVLVKACGEPLRRDSAQERVGSGSSQKTVRVQRWYYKNSGRRLERVVMLHEGKIIAVRTGER